MIQSMKAKSTGAAWREARRACGLVVSNPSTYCSRSPEPLWCPLTAEEQVFAASESHFRPNDLAAVATVKSKFVYLTHREEPAASGKWGAPTPAIVMLLLGNS